MKLSRLAVNTYRSSCRAAPIGLWTESNRPQNWTLNWVVYCMSMYSSLQFYAEVIRWWTPISEVWKQQSQVCKYVFTNCEMAAGCSFKGSSCHLYLHRPRRQLRGNVWRMCVNWFYSKSSFALLNFPDCTLSLQARGRDAFCKIQPSLARDAPSALATANLSKGSFSGIQRTGLLFFSTRLKLA